MKWIFIPFLLLALASGGCETAVQQYFFGETEISAPLVAPPLHASRTTQDEAISFSGYATINNQSIVRGATDRPVLQPGRFNDSLLASIPLQNVTVNLPKVSIGLQVDIAVSRSFAVFGGVDFSQAGGTELNSGLIGLSTVSQSANSGIRVDAGVFFRKYRFTTESVVVTEVHNPSSGTSQSVTALLQRGEKSDWDLFATATIYSTDDEALVSGFCSFGYFQQTFLSIDPLFGIADQLNPFMSSVDIRKTQRADYLFVFPGLSLRIAGNARLLAGVRIVDELSLAYMPKYFFLPSFQVQYRM